MAVHSQHEYIVSTEHTDFLKGVTNTKLSSFKTGNPTSLY